MANWLNDRLKAYGIETRLCDLGMQAEGLPLPPAILGRIGNESDKKTVLIYGHFDVQPVCFSSRSLISSSLSSQALLSDGWETEPFTLTVKPNGQMLGRGSSDDKGPILGWLNVLQYYHDNHKELPVNIRFCFEGMEESGSEGLDQLVQTESRPGGWFSGVDCACIVRLSREPFSTSRFFL